MSGLDAGLAENAGLRALVALDLGDEAAAAQWATLSRDYWRGLGRNAGMAWAGGIVALVEEARSGPEAALLLHAGSLTGYAIARFEPLPLDGFLAPAPSSLAARVDAVERAGSCALVAHSLAAGSYAIETGARERGRTGIVRSKRLQESLDGILETSTLQVPGGEIESFDDALAKLAGMLEGSDPT